MNGKQGLIEWHAVGGWILFKIYMIAEENYMLKWQFCSRFIFPQRCPL